MYLYFVQIIKILNMYTPGDDYEEKVPMSFIKKAQLKLMERNETTEQVCFYLKFCFSGQ